MGSSPISRSRSYKGGTCLTDFRVLVCGNECPKAQRADEVIRGLSKGKWKTIRWREGHKGWLRKKFVAVRAYRSLDGQPLTLGWLLGERPSRSQEGNWKFYFSNFPGETTLQDLVGIAHRRWLIERFHQDSKNLLGWDDFGTDRQGRPPLHPGLLPKAILNLAAPKRVASISSHLL
ncbi:hypothetical protein M1O13_00765 [Dehalococcoidia bacterium]|nr:hypothetical protein [Dehalococcoidia bacterium]